MGDGLLGQKFKDVAIFSVMISKLKLDLGSSEKNRKLFDSLRELVIILFAVVLAVGLERITQANSSVDYLLLGAVYLAVILSWWGYNLGVIAGPTETNRICYAIDIILVVLYWFMIQYAFQLKVVLFLFIGMFLLYVCWEWVRVKDSTNSLIFQKKVEKALKINVFFTILFILLLLAYLKLQSLSNLIIIAFLFLLPSIYRILVGKAYIKNENNMVSDSNISELDIQNLCEKAKHASKNAKCDLSHFPVGAAILTNSKQVFTGCNVEFDNYSNTLHAEEVAIGSMIASGETKPLVVAVYTSAERPNYPCGMCLQSLSELGGGNLLVIACNEENREEKQLAELLTSTFKL